jgi:ribosomal protein uS13
MARITGVDLPPGKRAEIGLTYIYGVGRTRSKSLLHRAGIDFNKKIRDLSEDDVNRVRQILEEEGAVEGDLRKEISMNIKASHRDGLLPGAAPPPLAAGSRPAHPYQRAHAQRAAPRHRGE